MAQDIKKGSIESNETVVMIGLKQHQRMSSSLWVSMTTSEVG